MTQEDMGRVKEALDRLFADPRVVERTKKSMGLPLRFTTACWCSATEGKRNVARRSFSMDGERLYVSDRILATYFEFKCVAFSSSALTCKLGCINPYHVVAIGQPSKDVLELARGSVPPPVASEYDSMTDEEWLRKGLRPGSEPTLRGMVQYLIRNRHRCYSPAKSSEVRQRRSALRSMRGHIGAVMPVTIGDQTRTFPLRALLYFVFFGEMPPENSAYLRLPGCPEECYNPEHLRTHLFGAEAWDRAKSPLAGLLDPITGAYVPYLERATAQEEV